MVVNPVDIATCSGVCKNTVWLFKIISCSMFDVVISMSSHSVEEVIPEKIELDNVDTIKSLMYVKILLGCFR